MKASASLKQLVSGAALPCLLSLGIKWKKFWGPIKLFFENRKEFSPCYEIERMDFFFKLPPSGYSFCCKVAVAITGLIRGQFPWEIGIVNRLRKESPQERT